jgi:hypothetical protein
MECYECVREGMIREAAGLCHNCSAALCIDHICEVRHPIIKSRVLAGTIVFPNRPRILLCRTCKVALEQIPLESFELPSSSGETCAWVTEHDRAALELGRQL